MELFEFNILRTRESIRSALKIVGFDARFTGRFGRLVSCEFYELFIVSSDGDDSPPPPRKIKDNDGTNAKRKRVPTTPAVAKVAFCNRFHSFHSKTQRVSLFTPFGTGGDCGECQVVGRCEKKMKRPGQRKEGIIRRFPPPPDGSCASSSRATSRVVPLFNPSKRHGNHRQQIRFQADDERPRRRRIHFWTPCHEHPFYASVHKT